MTADIHKIMRHIWPEWKVIDPPIGKGAFGTVYKAVRSDMAGESYSAIKLTVIPRDNSELEELRAEGLTPDQTSTYLQRIVQDYSTEIKMMMSVKGYTNIVTIDDYQIIKAKTESVWCILIRMELLTPLTKHIAAQPMDEEAIVRLGIDLCTALDVCSAKSIIHRDIKPENIFVNDHGIYKLGDFGVARNLERITNGLSKKGTPNYMAPEVYKATVKDTDFAAACKVDIYSLGMVLYWISNASRLPFLSTHKQLTSPDERKRAFIRRMDGEALPPPENVSPALQRIILKACAYEPEDRFGSAKEMRNALIRYSLNKELKEPEPPEPQDQEDMTVTSSSETVSLPPSSSPASRPVSSSPAAASPASPSGAARVSPPAQSRKPDSDDTSSSPARTSVRLSRSVILLIAAVVIVALAVASIVFIVSGDSSGKSGTPRTVSPGTAVTQKNVLTSSVPGDINGDRITDLKDLVRLEKYLNGQDVQVCSERLDINGDGNVNSADLRLLQDHLCGKAVTIH